MDTANITYIKLIEQRLVDLFKTNENETTTV